MKSSGCAQSMRSGNNSRSCACGYRHRLAAPRVHPSLGDAHRQQQFSAIAWVCSSLGVSRFRAGSADYVVF